MFCGTLLATLILLVGHSVLAEEDPPALATDKRPTKIWNLTGPLGKTPKQVTDDYHVYGLDWGQAELKFYVDGVLVRSVENTHWHQPLFLIFDSETMPE